MLGTVGGRLHRKILRTSSMMHDAMGCVRIWKGGAPVTLKTRALIPESFPQLKALT